MWCVVLLADRLYAQYVHDFFFSPFMRRFSCLCHRVVDGSVRCLFNMFIALSFLFCVCVFFCSCSLLVSTFLPLSICLPIDCVHLIWQPIAMNRLFHPFAQKHCKLFSSFSFFVLKSMLPISSLFSVFYTAKWQTVKIRGRKTVECRQMNDTDAWYKLISSFKERKIALIFNSIHWRLLHTTGKKAMECPSGKRSLWFV